MEILFAPFQPFVLAPWRALGVAVVFLLMSIDVTRRHGFHPYSAARVWVATAAWVLIAMNEYVARRNGWNIRIDLILLVPLLYLATLAGFVGWLSGLKATDDGEPRG